MSDKQIYYEWDLKIQAGEQWQSSQVERMLDEVYQLNGENIRLRDALEKIANHRMVQGAYLRIPDIARAALEPKP
jgi:hypothetical protein